jgi:outer membrane receptor protein involved in Fe transport
MKNSINSSSVVRMAMFFALAVAPVLVTTTDVAAQEITGQVDGTILQPNGQPATGITATITDSRDGRRQTSTADSRGVVSFRGMGAGGPYTVRIDGGNYENITVTDIYADIGGTSTFTISLSEADSAIDEITVTASQISMVTVASGPSSTFSLEDITNMPSTTRQIRDIIRIDPRVSIGRTGDGGDQSGSISCLGGSSRTNSFTIDGVRATDAFGLNLSGNLSRFTFPIPFDTVDAAAVEFAPVSVEYGQFSGCNINVVTKSGENDFHGSAFYLFNSDSLTGDEIGGNLSNSGVANTGDFERKNFGFDFSGPIIEDKLFFYVAYEETDTATINPYGTADSNFQRKGTFTTAEVNRISGILSSKYGRDAGTIVTNLPVVSERVFLRLDWNINDDHRVEFNYSDLQESTVIGDDIGTGRGQFTFSDNFHARGSDSQTYALRLYSDWSDRLSTEIRYSTQSVIDLQNPVGGGEAQDDNLPRIAIGACGLCGRFGGEFFGQSFVSGPGTFRSANKLTTDKDQFKVTADYHLGDHTYTVGFEHESLDIYNLFIINATGTVFFNGIDELDDGIAYDIRKGGSYTQDPNDAAAIFTREINSIFLQDTWDVTDNLEVIYGLRYDWYTSDDMPLLNPNYVSRYGFSNQVGFDGLDAVQPRLGFNYTMPDSFGDTRINAGFGVFSGNDPTVWFSNAYQNFGGALGVGSVTGFAGPTTCTGAELDVLAGGTFSGVPTCVVEAAQNQALNNAGAVNATDPNFKLPTINRYSIGIEHNTDFDSDFFSGWNVKADFIYSDLNDSVEFLDLGLTQTNTAPDGRPIYATVDPLITGCAASFNGIGKGYSGLVDACYGGLQHIIMTNRQGDDGYTLTASIQASKMFEWGDGWMLNVGGGYAYNESEVGNPGNSFTASGNFRAVVTDDLANSPVGGSYRNTPHNFTFRGTLEKDFIADHTTSITAFLQVREGHPLSLTYNRGFASGFGDSSGRARNLLYVPTGPTDPKVNFNMSAADTAAFFAFTDSLGLARGAIAPKGVLDEDWSTDLDIRIQQEIPFFGGSRVKLFLDIENFLNLIDSDNGVKRYVNTTDILSAVAVIDGSVASGAQTYNYDSFSPIVESADTLDSLYKIQLGIRGEF